jgi:hypothetical protein
MEISLNLLWLGIALISIGIWIFRWRSASNACAISGAVALGCALILLFPSISVTDDLHPQVVAVDALGGKRNMCRLISCIGHGVSQNSVTALKLPRHPLVAVLSNLSARDAFTISGIVTEKASLSPQTSRTSLSGRSPPVSLFC